MNSCGECGELHDNGPAEFCGEWCRIKFIKWQNKKDKDDDVN